MFVTRPTTFSVGFVEAGDGQGPRLFVDIHGTGYQGKKAFDVGGLVEHPAGRRADRAAGPHHGGVFAAPVHLEAVEELARLDRRGVVDHEPERPRVAVLDHQDHGTREVRVGELRHRQQEPWGQVLRLHCLGSVP